MLELFTARFRRRVAWCCALGCVLLLMSCSLAPIVAEHSVDYNRTVEETSNVILVTNILRARDEAPLYFSDLSQIRGSLTASLSGQSSFPFGSANRPPTGTGVRNFIQNTLSLSTNPTFDIAPSNTKQFYQGINQPLSKDILGYYIQRGVEADWIFSLFVSKIEVLEPNPDRKSSDKWVVTETRTYYDPSAPDTIDPMFNYFVSSWYALRPGPSVKVSSQPKNFGPPVARDAKALVDAAAAGLGVAQKAPTEGTMQFTKASSQAVLCVPSIVSRQFTTASVVPISVTKSPAPDEEPAGNPCAGIQIVCGGEMQCPKLKYTNIPRFRLYLRSVEGIFYYLGWVQKHGANFDATLQEANNNAHRNMYPAKFPLNFHIGSFADPNRICASLSTTGVTLITSAKFLTITRL